MKTLFLSLLLIVTSAFATPQEVKIVVPYSAGGPTDKVVRLLCTELSNVNYLFVPEYRLGAGGSIAANHVAQASGTVLMVTSNGLVTSPVIDSTVGYNPVKDFILVDYLGTEPLILTVNASSHIIDFKDFIKKSSTNFMPYGSAGVSTSGHITGAIIANNNKNLAHVPYKGSSAALTDLLAGNIIWTVDSDLNVKSFITDGKLKPLAVYFHHRLNQYPDVPTIKELGINDRGFYRWHIILANQSADKQVLKYVKTRLNEPGIRKKISNLGIDPQRPANTATFFSDELEKMHSIIRDYDLK